MIVGSGLRFDYPHSSYSCPDCRPGWRQPELLFFIQLFEDAYGSRTVLGLHTTSALEGKVRTTAAAAFCNGSRQQRVHHHVIILIAYSTTLANCLCSDTRPSTAITLGIRDRLKCTAVKALGRAASANGTLAELAPQLGQWAD